MPAASAAAIELDRLAVAAMRARGLLPEFSPQALQQAAALDRAEIETGPAIRDLRALPWSSVDNDDSRDLDQIEVAEPQADGSLQVLVGRADVDGSVKTGSPIDAHARANTTSVYTAARIFPMLPQRLSTDLTSLAQDQERMAVVMEMTVAADGSVGRSAIYRALVVNRAQLAYPAVAAWLEGTGPPPARLADVTGLDAQLRIQDRAAQALRARRRTRGALDLESAEARAVFDGGLLVDLRPDPQNRAQELIEDFMIAANGVSARFLTDKGLPSLRRILRTPQRWDRLVALARGEGDQLPGVADAGALSAFLARRRTADPERFEDLSLSVIKLLGRGEYVLERPGEQAAGHFGLAARDYTHSTAPNRRFPDLITQRLLKAALVGHPAPYGEAELQALAAHCTAQEDNAAKVERSLRKSAAAMLLAPRIGQEFDAIVTGAAQDGTWVRIREPAAEGRVVTGFQGLDVGDRVRVKLIHTDIARGFIDFAHQR
jgi:exoribonuclease-2